MARQAFAGDLAGRHIERGEERRRAIARLVMGHRASAALFQRQAGLRPFKRPNLALPVDRRGHRRRPRTGPADGGGISLAKSVDPAVGLLRTSRQSHDQLKNVQCRERSA